MQARIACFRNTRRSPSHFVFAEYAELFIMQERDGCRCAKREGKRLLFRPFFDQMEPYCLAEEDIDPVRRLTMQADVFPDDIASEDAAGQVHAMK